MAPPTRAGALPAFTLSGDVAGLGVSPLGTWPGVSGLTAVLSGTDERGRIALRVPIEGVLYDLTLKQAEEIYQMRQH